MHTLNFEYKPDALGGTIRIGWITPEKFAELQAELTVFIAQKLTDGKAIIVRTDS